MTTNEQLFDPQFKFENIIKVNKNVCPFKKKT